MSSKRGKVSPKPMRKKRPAAIKTKSKVRRTDAEAVLFYRYSPGQEALVFAPPKVAQYIAAIHHALAARTWGEFKSRIPPKEYKQLLKRVQDGELDPRKSNSASKRAVLVRSRSPSTSSPNSGTVTMPSERSRTTPPSCHPPIRA